jgi:hypothetical protein
LLPVVVALVVHFFSRKNQITRESFADSELSSLFFVVLAVVVILTQWWWLLPLALPTGLALYLLSATGQRKLSGRVRTVWVVTTVLFIAATLIMLYLRQLNLDWWIRSWDVTMFETKSYSIATLGSSGNLSLVGYPMNYHWFAIAWLGSLTVVCDLSPWLSIAQVSPVYSTVAIGCLILAISKRASPNWITKFAILFVFSFATSAYSPANPPNIISLVWIFAGFVIADEYFSKRQNKMFAAFGVVAISAFSGKVSAGFTLLGAFALTDLWLAIKDKSKLFGAAIRTIILATATVAAFYIVIGGPNRLGNNTIRLSFRWPGIEFGVESERSNLIYAFGWLGSVLLLAPITFGLLTTKNIFKAPKHTLIFCIFGTIAGLIPWSTVHDDGMSYFLSSSKVFSGIGTAISLSILKDQPIFKSKSFPKVCTFTLLAIFAGVTTDKTLGLEWANITTNRGGPTIIRLLIVLTSLIFAVLVSSTILRIRSTKPSKRPSRQLVVSFSTFILISALSNPFLNYFQKLPENFKASEQMPGPVGTIGIETASKWLKVNSDDPNSVATNRFCVESGASECNDPKLFLVSATSRQQVWIEGPARTIGYGGDDETLYPAWAKERLDLSRGFADNPNAEITAKLLEYGVDWFYLFKQNTTNRNWEPYGSVKYENDEILIIKLKNT